MRGSAADNPIRDENLALILSVPARKALNGQIQRAARTASWLAMALAAVGTAAMASILTASPIVIIAVLLGSATALTLGLGRTLWRYRRMRRGRAELDALSRRYNRPV